MVITGHGVPPDLIAEMDVVTKAFFDLPLVEKQKIARGPDPLQFGYIALGADGLSRARGETVPGDLKETLSVGRVDTDGDPYYRQPETAPFFAANKWPEQPAALRPVWSAYYGEMLRLSDVLLRIFAVALGAPEEFFLDKVAHQNSKILARHYPAQNVPPEPGQLRAGAHTDFGSITILHQDDAPGGLQVRSRSGAWHDIPATPGSYVVNIGDLMQRWTNDRFVSSLHRVINPPADKAAAARRLSFGFFQLPDPDALITCVPTCIVDGELPRYQPTTSGAHYHAMMKVIQSKPSAAA
jgi:isopenicillin N synthase-like dioxygenase